MIKPSTNVQQNSPKSNVFFKLTDLDGVKYLDSRAAAVELGIAHDHFIGLIESCGHVIEDQAGRIIEKPDSEKPDCIYFLFTENQLLCLNNFLPHNSVSDDFMKKVIATFNNVRELQQCVGSSELQIQEPQIFNGVELIDLNGAKYIDSRLFSEGLGIDHGNLMETIRKHRQTIEENFGPLPFQTGVAKNAILGSNPPKYVLLNEGQASFIGSLSKNTLPVIKFKAKIVKAFLLAKEIAQQLSTITSEQLSSFRDDVVSAVILQLPTVMAPLIEPLCAKMVDTLVKPVHAVECDTAKEGGTVEVIGKPSSKLEALRKLDLASQSAKKEEKLLTEVQAANRLHMPLKIFRRLQSLGVGPETTMSGKIIMYRPSDIDAFDDAAEEFASDPAAKRKTKQSILRKLALCENIKGNAPSGARTDLADIKRIRLIQDYIELTEGKKPSQAVVIKEALNLLCEKKVFSTN